MQPDIAGREPPLHGTTQRVPSAPAVRVTAALALTRVVHASQDRPHHVSTLLAGQPPSRVHRWETREAPEETRMVVIAAALVVVVLVVLAITSDR